MVISAVVRITECFVFIEESLCFGMGFFCGVGIYFCKDLILKDHDKIDVKGE